MAEIILRVAGPYTVTSGDGRISVNGVVASLHPAPSSSGLAFLVNTGCIGANGKPDFVGLTIEQYAPHAAIARAFFTAKPDAAAQRTRQIAERAFDHGMNEGGEGYNPHRLGDKPTYRSAWR